MWSRYRKWKHAAVPLLAVVALSLMKEQPDESPKWIIGMVLAALLALLYIIEEAVWIPKGNQRPCLQCGRPIPIRAFRIVMRCPHCGSNLG